MATKKAPEFAVPTDAEVANGSNIWIFSNPTTGKLYKPTAAQVKAVMQTFPTLYTSTGSEGTTITIPAIVGKDIVAILKEGSVLYPVTDEDDLDEASFYWDDATVELGQAIDRAGIRFLILYKTK